MVTTSGTSVVGGDFTLEMLGEDAEFDGSSPTVILTPDFFGCYDVMVGKFTDIFDPEGFSIIRFIEVKDIKMAYSGESWFFSN